MRRAEIDRVVVILSASRSGSSLLYSLLRQTGAFASLTGEHNPLLRSSGVVATPAAGIWGTNWSDADVNLSEVRLERLWAELSRELSAKDRSDGVVVSEDLESVVRLLMRQWARPEHDWAQVSDDLRGRLRLGPCNGKDLIDLLDKSYDWFNGGYYDLDRDDEVHGPPRCS